MSQPTILTPKPGPIPRINGAKVFGVRPGSPVCFKVAATGAKPLTYSAENLPPGVRIQAESGILTGTIKPAGIYRVILHVTNAKGAATRELRIECGDQICLTPPMGWNSWYVYSIYISQEKIQAMAKGMVDSGLIDHGWIYINIDDCWQGRRDPATKRLHANENFPDMKAMCDSIHGLGLKTGIYSTPWLGSYAGYYGGSIRDASCDLREFEADPKDRLEPSQVFGNQREMRKLVRFHGAIGCEEIDARQYAEWGFDYLKYDWHPNDIPHITSMVNALKQSGRDIVYSLSNRANFELAPEYQRLANLWRTTGDIQDNWRSISRIGFNQDRWGSFGGPGHWNDPDMLQVGMTNTPHLKKSDSRPTNLTCDEQYLQVSLWTLLAAPLLLSCDLTKLDEFTTSLLTNDEIIDIDQDPLGRPATTVAKKRGWWGKGGWQILARPLEDGSKAVGLFNLGTKATSIMLKWSTLQIHGKQSVRDVWRQQDLGTFEVEFTAQVPSHGVVMVRISPESV